jgi:parallel beta-helix repeat protein
MNFYQEHFMKAAIVLAVLLTIPSLAFPAFIHVPDDYPTILEAIDAAVNGDTVLVKPGTYLENIDFLGKAIVVRGEQGQDATWIDGGWKAPVVVFQTGEGPSSVLEGFTLTKGHGVEVKGLQYGAGIFCKGASPKILNCKLYSNNTDCGGGMACVDNAAPCLDGCFVDQNSGDLGGGIYSCDSSPTIMNSVISNNNADTGAGIFCKNGSPLIQSNRITRNDNLLGYDGSGLGISCEGGAPTIIGNVVHQNGLFGTSHGPGIDCTYFSSPTILFNTISHTYGDGLSVSNAPTARVAGNLIHDNSICGISIHDSGTHQIVNNTIYHNYSAGLHASGSTASVTNTVLWDNAPELDVVGGSPQITYCNVKGGWPGTGNIDSDPQFVAFGYWDDNGTPGFPFDDFWVDGDCHLTFDSPCRDSGDNAAVNELYDLEGDPRIAWGGTVDMGADEFYTHLYCTGEFTPGGAIEGKFVGLPATSPVGLFLGAGVLDSPLPTAWGSFHLQAPWLLIPLVPIPSNGMLILPATIPATPSAPYDLPMQALIGLDPDSLTNAYVLEVR